MISATAFYARQMKKQTLFCGEAKEVADKTIRNFHKFGKENISAAEMEKERETLRKKDQRYSICVCNESTETKENHKASDLSSENLSRFSA